MVASLTDGPATTSKRQLASAEVTTNAAAGSAQALVEGIGSGYPASIQAKAATVLNQITYLLAPGRAAAHPEGARPGRRQRLLDQVIDSYSGVLSILFALEDEITTGSGDVQLGDDVRALTALSSAEDQASQQRAILYGALIASALNDTGSNSSPGNNVTGPVGAGRLRRARRVHHRAGPAVRRRAVVRLGRQPGPDGGGQQRRGQPSTPSPPS